MHAHIALPRIPRRRRFGAMLGLVAGCVMTFAAPVAATGEERVAGLPVVTHTYLAATPGHRDALARFIVANWFEMDRTAVAQGLFRSYRLLENPRTDEDWDLIVEVAYNDACGYPCVAERFEAIRGAHVTVPVDGLVMKDLGRVVRSVAFQERPAG
jgi:hypothetical protein